MIRPLEEVNVMKKMLLVYILLISAFALYVLRFEYTSQVNSSWEDRGCAVISERRIS